MTSFSLNIATPFFNYSAQQQIGFGPMGVSASANAGGASASAGGFPGLFGQLSQASAGPQQQQQQNPLMQLMQMMMQFMQKMMQMLGMAPKQQQQGQSGANAAASAGAGGANASAAASAGSGGSSAAAAASAGGSASSPSQPSSPSKPEPEPKPEKKGPNPLLGLLAIGGIALVAAFPGLGMSPLVLDTNKDGKVSAKKGKGVDIDGDGKPDGAASDGDKMLAMGDVNGNGKIDGTEVFGNKTVDPFTGQQLNAANGFDALNQVAKSAEQHTGIKCVDDNGNVDLKSLRQAIQQKTGGQGSLGYISGDNVTNLESLESQDASKINTSNYTNQQDSGAVQHNQLGSYLDNSGNTHKVDDVWFV